MKEKSLASLAVEVGCLAGRGMTVVSRLRVIHRMTRSE